MSPIKFLSWVLGVAFLLGIGDSFVHLTMAMGKAAVHAHEHDQISYEKYNNFLWGHSSQKNKQRHK